MSDYSSPLRRYVQGSALALSLIAGSMALTACDLTENHLKMDRAGNKEFQDYRDAMAPRLPLSTEDAAQGGGHGGIPALQPYVARTVR